MSVGAEIKRKSSRGVIWLWFASCDHFLFIITHSSVGAEPVSPPCWRVESLKWPWRNSSSPQSSREHPINVCKAALSLLEDPGYPHCPCRVSLQSPALGLYTNISTAIMGVLARRSFLLNVYSLKGLSAWQFPWTWTDCCPYEEDGVNILHSHKSPKIKCRWLIYQFLLWTYWTCISLHTEIVLLSQIHKWLHHTHGWSYVVFGISWKTLKWNTSSACTSTAGRLPFCCHTGLFLWVCGGVLESKYFSMIGVLQ